MSVEASESLSEVWTRWQGHVINGAFPLGRHLGSSDHSGVFLTRSETLGSADLAIKLVPANRALAELLLPRWKRARVFAHDHLLPLWQWGGCQLEGLPYLYVAMEYADQTLAQLLQHRALTEDEAREMLSPILEALAFLHGQDLVQGQLKPANILVVADQLKLASDTVRRLGEGSISTHGPTPYDPPEGRQGSTSPAGDVWALGVTLYEALARRLPSGLGESREDIMPPPEFPLAFRDIVVRCLSVNPKARPTVAELAAWASRKPAAVAAVAPVATAESIGAADLAETIEVAALAVPAPAAPETTPAPPETAPAPPPSLSMPVSATPLPSQSAPPPVDAAGPRSDSAAPPPQPRSGLFAILGVVVVGALVWAGMHLFTGRPSAPSPQVAAPAATAPITPPPAPAPAVRPAPSPGAALHQVTPEVPAGARRTIRGHIKVWVRVVIEQDGAVLAAIPDRTGPSRYFERLAVDAAKRWTFPPADTAARRVMQLQFDFSRDGATVRAVTPR